MDEKDIPVVSVCMPYYQRQKELDRSLSAYTSVYKDAPVRLQISVCDDGSPEPVNAPGCIVTFLPKKHVCLNPCVPMNVAVRASTADIVVLTNPEIEHTSAVLVKMIGLLDSPDTYVTASCFEPERQLWLAGPKTMYGKNGRQPVPEGSHFHFCAMLHRSLFERAGGFDEDYRTGQGCDDNDWLWRLNSIGAKFVHCDDSVTHYRTRHRWTGTTQRNASILRKKWGHSW